MPASKPPSLTRLLLGGTTRTSSTKTSEPGEVPSKKMTISDTVHAAGMTRLPLSCVHVLGATAVLFCSQGNESPLVHPIFAARRTVSFAAPVWNTQALTP